MFVFILNRKFTVHLENFNAQVTQITKNSRYTFLCGLVIAQNIGCVKDDLLDNI